MKVINSSSISSFGGLNFVLQELDQLKIPCLLHDQLPLLPPQSKYCWKDLLYSFWSVFFCGGDCAEDLALHLRPTFKGNPLLQAPSADRVLERMKSLSLPSEIFTAPRGTSTHKFSINLPLNRLNIKLLKRLSAIQSKNVILDYDNTVLFTKKADAAKTPAERSIKR